MHGGSSANLEVGVPSAAVLNSGVYIDGGWHNQLTSEFIYCIKEFLEIPT